MWLDKRESQIDAAPLFLTPSFSQDPASENGSEAMAIRGQHPEWVRAASGALVDGGMINRCLGPWGDTAGLDEHLA